MITFPVAKFTVGTALVGASLLGASATPALASPTPSPAASPAAASPAGASPAAARGCRTGELPPAVLGAPGVKPHQPKGVYLWHGKNGYALRVTEPTSKRFVVTGAITVSGDINDVKRVGLEKDDSVAVHGRTLTFRFVNHGGIDGVNFGAECSKTVRVALRSAGAALAPELVYLGGHRAHPTSVPFTIERAHDSTPATVR